MKKGSKIAAGMMVAALTVGAGLTMVACGHDHNYASEFDTVCNSCREERTIDGVDSWDGTKVDVPDAVGSEITISSAEQLAGLAASVNQGVDYSGYTIKLACNIDLQEKEWTPIGNSDNNRFYGVFDGQGHTVAGLKISQRDTAAVNIGFFGSVDGNETVIKNLNFTNASVVGNHFLGVVVGYTHSYVKIDNCDVVNSEILCLPANGEDGDKAGMITGYMNHHSQLTNSSATDCEVFAARDAGQLVGCIVASNGAVQLNNIATNVNVVDNSGVDDVETNDNIRKEIVGRVV